MQKKVSSTLLLEVVNIKLVGACPIHIKLRPNNLKNFFFFRFFVFFLKDVEKITKNTLSTWGVSKTHNKGMSSPKSSEIGGTRAKIPPIFFFVSTTTRKQTLFCISSRWGQPSHSTEPFCHRAIFALKSHSVQASIFFLLCLRGLRSSDFFRGRFDYKKMSAARRSRRDCKTTRKTSTFFFFQLAYSVNTFCVTGHPIDVLLSIDGHILLQSCLIYKEIFFFKTNFTKCKKTPLTSKSIPNPGLIFGRTSTQPPPVAASAKESAFFTFSAFVLRFFFCSSASASSARR